MAFPEDIQPATPARYLFKLVSGANEVICNPEPLEWASGTLEINRDIDVGGVFSSFQVDSLTFVGTGAQLLKQLFNAAELNAECTLIVYWWKGSIREYVEFPTRFDINFNVYEIVKVGKFAMGVRVKAINSSTQTKLDSRIDVDVDIKKLVSIGGVEIQDYPALKKGLHYDATNIYTYGNMDAFNTNGWLLPRYAGYVSYCSVPFTTIIKSDYPEFTLVNFQNRIRNVDNIGRFFNNSRFDYIDVDFHYLLNVNVLDASSSTQPWTLELIETNAAGIGIQFIDLASWGDETGIQGIQGNTQISFQKDSDLRLVIRVSDTPDITCYLVSSFIEFNQTIAQTPEKQTEGFPIYETFERVCQHILDTQYPFYSDFFGRNENSFNNSGGYYSSESQLRFAHIQTGLNQRGQLLSDATGTIPINFKNLFKTAKTIWNIGYTLELRDTIRIRIEQYAYFFQNVESLDLSDRVNKYDIVSMVMPELVPLDIQSGFNNFEYLQVNGNGEPNTTNKRTTIVNTNTKLDNISPYRGDTKGIFDNLSNPLEQNGTTDTKGDSSIFIVKTQRNNNYDWQPEKGENITIEEGTSLFKDELLNRYFTPTRMIKRHGSRIKAGLTKILTSVLRFQTSDKSQTLKTTGEGYTISENQDINVSDLANPIYKPMKHTIECRFDYSDLEVIQQYQFRYITFSSEISGYLLNLKKKNNEDKAEISIIQRA